MKNDLFSSLYFLLALSAGLKDSFWRRKIKYQARELFDNFLALPKLTNVAHYKESFDQICSTILKTNDLLEIIAYLKITPLSPVLLAQKAILSLLKTAIDQKKKLKTTRPSTPESEREDKKVERPALNLKADSYPLLVLRKKIPELLRGQESLSSKDIVSALGLNLSSRTIQRHLAKLIRNGTIRKKTEDGLIKYFLP